MTAEGADWRGGPVRRGALFVQLIFDQERNLNCDPPVADLIVLDGGANVLYVGVMNARDGYSSTGQRNLDGILDRVRRDSYQIDDFFNHIRRLLNDESVTV
jgi:hypothetical protein